MAPVVEVPPGLVAAFRRARRVAVLTGAGISAESGVPTFRDAQTGLWARFRPEDLATPEAFGRDPGLVWRWYAWRRALVRRARPNAGHRALAAMEGRFEAFTLITQNVDDLHRRAGSADPVSLHGELFQTRCSAEGTVVEDWDEAGPTPPGCPRCGAPLRPGVVWFGEALPAGAWTRAEAAAHGCDLFLSAGTSALVYPAAGLPDLALEAGATLVEINPEPTPISARARFRLGHPAGRALPAIIEAVWGPSGGKR